MNKDMPKNGIAVKRHAFCSRALDLLGSSWFVPVCFAVYMLLRVAVLLVQPLEQSSHFLLVLRSGRGNQLRYWLRREWRADRILAGRLAWLPRRSVHNHQAFRGCWPAHADLCIGSAGVCADPRIGNSLCFAIDWWAGLRFCC